MFDANACAIELLKMKNSEEFKKDVAEASSSTATPIVPEVPTPVPSTIKPPDPETVVVVPPNNESSGLEEVNSTDPSNSNSTEKSASTTVTANTNNAGLSLDLDQPMETDPTGNGKPDEKSKDQLNNLLEQSKSLSEEETSKKQLPAQEDRPLVTPSVPLSPVCQTPSTSANVSSSTANVNVSSSSNTTSVNEDDAMSIGSSTDDDEEDVHVNSFARDNMGSGSSDPAEELIIKRNTEYLFNRCTSLMQRVQGIMQGTAGRHVSKQLQAVLEHPGLNPALRPHHQNRSSLSSFQDSNPSLLTKQALSELQFTGKLMSNIIRHSMSRQLDPTNDDSATEESDTDDDEVVLPDERMMEPGPSSKLTPYLPVENNPFIEAIKLEKQYEARRTSLENSIVECEYSLTKSLHLRKHCKGRKPLFQLEKPTASSNIINIPVDPTSSVKFYHDSKPATIKRVSDMMQRRSSLEQQERIKINGNGDSNSSNSLQNETSVDAPGVHVNIGNSSAASPNGLRVDSSPRNGGSKEERNSFIPTIKSLGSDGISVLGVEFVNSSDPNQSASRCAAIKRPDKNRKVFQLGGIQNIFRDPYKLPSVRCTCYGRHELCALCLGRAKKKAEINHVFMNHKDKLAILDETFHKSLSLSEDVPLEVLLTSSSVGNTPLIPPSSSIQQLIKARSEQFPPDFLETGPKPKKPRVYDIKPYVEIMPARSPKKDGRYSEETMHVPRKRPPPRKSQSSFDDKDLNDYAGKGFGWPSRERKDSMRRTRNQEFDIDNIVIPYSIAASTRVEQLVYKPIETPRWRLMDYSEIFSAVKEDKIDGELEDMSNAAFLDRHNKCEVEEKKRFTQSIKKALNATRKTRRLDSTGRSESISESTPLSSLTTDDLMSVTTPPPVPSPGKSNEKEVNSGASSVTEENKGTSTPVTDSATVITEAMANQALKSLFKVGVGRRRTISTTLKPETEEEETPVIRKFVDPWPQRRFPLPEVDYKQMVDEMQKSYLDYPVDIASHSSTLIEDSPASPKCL